MRIWKEGMINQLACGLSRGVLRAVYVEHVVGFCLMLGSEMFIAMLSGGAWCRNW